MESGVFTVSVPISDPDGDLDVASLRMRIARIPLPAVWDGNSLSFNFTQGMALGSSDGRPWNVRIDVTARDLEGNEAGFTYRIWGRDQELRDLVESEFSGLIAIAGHTNTIADLAESWRDAHWLPTDAEYLEWTAGIGEARKRASEYLQAATLALDTIAEDDSAYEPGAEREIYPDPATIQFSDWGVELLGVYTFDRADMLPTIQGAAQTVQDNVARYAAWAAHLQEFFNANS